MNAKVGKKIQSRREQSEDKLVCAAISLFSKKGFDGSTTREISQEAAVNEALIIRYFGGKEGLLLEIVKRFVDQKRSEPLPYPAQLNVEEELACNAHYILRDLQHCLDLYRILLGRSTADAKLRRRISEILPSDGDPRLRERLRLLRRKASFPKGVSTDLLMLIPFQCLAAMFVALTALNINAAIYARHLETLVRASVRGLGLSSEKP